MRQVAAYKRLKTMENHLSSDPEVPFGTPREWSRSRSLTGGGLLEEVPTVRL